MPTPTRRIAAALDLLPLLLVLSYWGLGLWLHYTRTYAPNESSELWIVLPMFHLGVVPIPTALWALVRCGAALGPMTERGRREMLALTFRPAGDEIRCRLRGRFLRCTAPIWAISPFCAPIQIAGLWAGESQLPNFTTPELDQSATGMVLFICLNLSAVAVVVLALCDTLARACRPAGAKSSLLHLLMWAALTLALPLAFYLFAAVVIGILMRSGWDDPSLIVPFLIFTSMGVAMELIVQAMRAWVRACRAYYTFD